MGILQWLQAIAALVFVLALIVGLAYLARRFGMIQLAQGGPDKRLKVVESLMLDPRRKLVVVKFDAREHVLLLSPAGDLVVTAQEIKPEPQP